MTPRSYGSQQSPEWKRRFWGRFFLGLILIVPVSIFLGQLWENVIFPFLKDVWASWLA